MPTGVSGYAWNQLNITEYPYDAEIMWGLGQYSTPLEPFHHFINGTQQAGLFLGQGNVTTWGVKLYPADGANSEDGEPYWQLRLVSLHVFGLSFIFLLDGAGKSYRADVDTAAGSG